MTLAECQGKTADKHLSFSKDELILVREQKDATWYSGELHGKVSDVCTLERCVDETFVLDSRSVGFLAATFDQRRTLRWRTRIMHRSEFHRNSRRVSYRMLRPSSDAPTASGDTAGDVYEAIYAFEAAEPTDLSFDVGDRIVVLKCDGEWWTGRIGDRTGTFPSNYVQKTVHEEEVAVAIAPFEGTQEDHLTFDKDQTIYIAKKDANGWYQGAVRVRIADLTEQ